MSAFPWDNLITGASTLAAALGSVELKGRSDRKARAIEVEQEDASARAERQSAAYGALVVSATEMLRIYRRRHEFGYWTTVPPGQEADLHARGDVTSGDLFRAAAGVELAGSEDARKSAVKLRRAAIDADDALTYGSQIDAIGPLDDFEATVGAFIDEVRSQNLTPSGTDGQTLSHGSSE